MKHKIPNHLKQYIVKQNYNQYTYIDQACWRFIMKVSIDFFKKHADNIYIKGLKDTGITVNQIPKISTINKKLLRFGWKAVCVRGFIPPQAFMEFQSLKILPIAADMRSHKHLTYTPSPDIVHEAAGHAPIIANKDYSKYLMEYGEIAAKAIFSIEDMDLYYAIRELSDIKESVNSTISEIKKCEKKLKNAYLNISYTSESSMLSRMNWWTVEYGLIGDIKNPKIYGAGLLSSVGESENCLDAKVKKIPFDTKCIKYKYDITEQQPHLFVTPSYNYLTKELKKFSKNLSYKKGGIYGLKEAIKAKTVCTIEFDNFIQISGIVDSFINKNNRIDYVKLIGPSQISIKNKELKSHGKSYHCDGYSTPIGNLNEINKPIYKLNKLEIKKLNLIKSKSVNLIFKSGINLKGTVENIVKKQNKIILITLIDCNVIYKNKILFDSSWGKFDLIASKKITSVFGGPADSEKYYGENKSFNTKYKSFNKRKLNQNKEIKILNEYFKNLNNYNNSNNKYDDLFLIYNKMKKNKIDDWLLKYQFLEKTNCNRNLYWIDSLYSELYTFSKKKTDLARAISRGLKLFNN